jgi:hypothetical protein
VDDFPKTPISPETVLKQSSHVSIGSSKMGTIHKGGSTSTEVPALLPYVGLIIPTFLTQKEKCIGEETWKIEMKDRVVGG